MGVGVRRRQGLGGGDFGSGSTWPWEKGMSQAEGTRQTGIT